MLAEEMEALKALALDILRHIVASNAADGFPNVLTALRILVTIPITVASGERSFSKLKLIKSYLRSSMEQERLNNLTILSIENDVAHSLNYTQTLLTHLLLPSPAKCGCERRSEFRCTCSG